MLRDWQRSFAQRLDHLSTPKVQNPTTHSAKNSRLFAIVLQFFGLQLQDIAR